MRISRFFKPILFAFAVSLIVGLFSGYAVADTGNGFNYYINDGEATVTGYNGTPPATLDVPSYLGGYPVTKINNYAFYANNDIKSVTLPYTLKTIDELAFAYCDNLESITIPESVTLLGNEVFRQCKCLDEIYVSEYNENYKSVENVLYSKDGKELIFCPVTKTGITIPDTVTKIENYAFYTCDGITNITLPAGLKTIGDFAFGFTSIESINIPKNVTDISSSAFAGGNTLTEITVDKDNTAYKSVDKILYSKDGKEIVFCPYGITNLTLPDTVTKICDYAFYDCYGLSSITIPEGVTYIGDSAFYDCINIENISLPDSVTNIGNEAFYNCNSLTTVNLGENICFIGERAFEDCSELTYNEYESGSYIGNSINPYVCLIQINNCDITSLTIHPDTKIISPLTISSCTGLESIAIPDGVKSICDRAFIFCCNLSEINIPDSVTYLGKSAFCDCSSLESVTLGNGITEIKEYTFQNCVSLKNIVLSDKLEKIGEGAFELCENLSEITLPASLKTIDKYAFCYTALKTINIPKNVSVISETCFSGCSDLESIFVDNGNNYFESSFGVLYNKSMTRLIVWPSGLKTVYIPDSVTSIAYQTEENFFSLVICNRASYADTCFNIPDRFSVQYLDDLQDGINKVHVYDYYVYITVSDGEFVSAVSAENSLSDTDFKYIKQNNKIYITECIKRDEIKGCWPQTVFIPETIDECPVVSVLSLTDYNEYSVKSIIFPDSVKSVNSDALKPFRCLENVSFGSGTVEINQTMFAYSNDLEAVTVSSDNTNYKSIDGVVYTKDVTKIVAVPLNIKNIIIPNTVSDFSLLNSINFDYSKVSFEQGNTNLNYSNGLLLTADGKTLLSVDNSVSGKVVIPSTIENFNAYCFANRSSITEVEFENGITEIAYGMFLNCTNLAKVTLPSTLITIEPDGFSNTGLTEVTLPAGLKDYDLSFQDCQKLKKVTLSDGITLIDMFAFSGSAVEEFIVPKSVKCFEYGSLSYISTNDICALKYAGTIYDWVKIEQYDDFSSIKTIYLNNVPIRGKLEIPTGITEINYSSFSHYKAITELKLSDSVKTVGRNSFEYTNLEKLDMGNGLITVEGGAFCYCEKLKTVIWSNRLQTISDYAFCNCAIESFVMPNSLETISGHSFYCCEMLKTIQCSDKLVSIGWEAFAYCGLTELIMTDSITEISDRAFAFCKNLKSVRWSDNIRVLGNEIFEGTGIEDITLPAGVTTVTYACYRSCENLKSVNIPECLTCIEEHSFAYCTSLTSVDIPKNVISIATDAFAGCSSLTALNVDNSNTEYKSVNGVLYSKDGSVLEIYPAGKTEAIFAPGVTTIASDAFSGCSKLTLITIPEGVTSIGDRCFENCKGVYYITVPDSVTSIGDMAFESEYYSNSTKTPIRCNRGSYAETYATNNGIPIIYIGEEQHGDINCDGIIDTKDIDLLKKYLTNYDFTTDTSTVTISEFSDCTGDKTVDGKDLIRLKKYIAGYNPNTKASTVTLD